jgi:hypothetical protein
MVNPSSYPLSLKTIENHLETLKIALGEQTPRQEGQRPVLQVRWHFEMGNAIILFNLNEMTEDMSRLEVVCLTEKTYAHQRIQVLEALNMRNRERAFSRSIDGEGRFVLTYIGFYLSQQNFPITVFEHLFQSLLTHFQDDFTVLETTFVGLKPSVYT